MADVQVARRYSERVRLVPPASLVPETQSGVSHGVPAYQEGEALTIDGAAFTMRKRGCRGRRIDHHLPENCPLVQRQDS